MASTIAELINSLNGTREGSSEAQLRALINNEMFSNPAPSGGSYSSGNSTLALAGLTPNSRPIHSVAPTYQKGYLSSLIDKVGNVGNDIGSTVMKPVNGFKDIVEGLIGREGGYVNDKADRGGETKYGITRTALAAYRGVPASQIKSEEIKSLTPQRAAHIYETVYYNKPGINKVDSLVLQNVMTDASANHGPANSIILMQKTLNDLGYKVSVDGRLGPQTLKAISSAQAAIGEDELNDAYVNRRTRFMRNIAKNDPTQKRFLPGWLNRASEFLTTQD